MKIQTKKETPAEQLAPMTTFGVRNRAGEPLPTPFRKRMERAFRADFTKVRVHRDPDAAKIGALAFARGENLHFAPGRYDTRSREGRRLIGHELAHVLQQRAGKVPARLGRGDFVFMNRRLEIEADRFGDAVSSRLEGAPRSLPSPPAAAAAATVSTRAAQCTFDVDEKNVIFENNLPKKISGTIQDKGGGTDANSNVSRPLNVLTKDTGIFAAAPQFESAHMVGRQFGGRGRQRNLIPVVSKFNQETYKEKVENKIDNHLTDEKTPVDLEVRATYPGNEAAAFERLMTAQKRNAIGRYPAIKRIMRKLFDPVPRNVSVKATGKPAKGGDDIDIVRENNLKPRTTLGDLNPPFGLVDGRSPDDELKTLKNTLGEVGKSPRFQFGDLLD